MNYKIVSQFLDIHFCNLTSCEMFPIAVKLYFTLRNTAGS